MKNTKLKKWAIIAGLIIICCILIALIGVKLADKPQTDDIPQSSSTASDEVTQNPEKNTEEKDIVIAPNPDSKPSDTGNADSAGTEQTIQPDPIKPEAPQSKQPIPEKPQSDKPQVADGEIYIPGFGAVPNKGGGGIGESSVLDPDHTDFDKIIGH